MAINGYQGAFSTIFWIQPLWKSNFFSKGHPVPRDSTPLGDFLMHQPTSPGSLKSMRIVDCFMCFPSRKAQQSHHHFFLQKLSNDLPIHEINICCWDFGNFISTRWVTTRRRRGLHDCGPLKFGVGFLSNCVGEIMKIGVGNLKDSCYGKMGRG